MRARTQYMREYSRRPEVKAKRDAYRKGNPEKMAEKRRKHSYGLTQIEYGILLDQQEGLCGICQNKMDTPCVDHCHETGKVRGLLCNLCNTGLGRLGDCIETLHSAIDYLECFRIDQVMAEARNAR